ncbi:MAG TPA: lipid-A-disaccharide synthase N-terminal domain-containing protein [Alphaproteobacteria bacterium]|nr:lipid-A-disaccharide synthase N-terminal domain-containing protein [Alphaproteobacteria bacterium]
MSYLAHWYAQAVHNPGDLTWGAIGFLGQAVFGIRFLIQWLRSEQLGRSVIPIAFWYCSLIGGAISLTYVIHLGAWPLIFGQGAPLVIYARNLYLVYRERRRTADMV